MQSVNSATVKQAPAESMVQLGQCVQRIIALLADNYDPDQPFLFSKLDIKDGFWRLAVSDENAWNFCYVLPSFEPVADIDDTLIVVPNCLQMGWCESPPFFCAASETARDVIDSLLQEVNLPAHQFEDQMLDSTTESALRNHFGKAASGAEASSPHMARILAFSASETLNSVASALFFASSWDGITLAEEACMISCWIADASRV